jgi:hypothetical protein
MMMNGVQDMDILSKVVPLYIWAFDYKKKFNYEHAYPNLDNIKLMFYLSSQSKHMMVPNASQKTYKVLRFHQAFNETLISY